MKQQRILIAAAGLAVFCGVSAAQPAEVPVQAHSTARLAGPRVSCAEIAQVIRRTLSSGFPDPQLTDTDAEKTDRDVTSFPSLLASRLDCTSALSVPQGVPLEVKKIFWDPALRNWEYSLRCLHPGDCVPFLIRARGRVARGAYSVPVVVMRRSTIRGPLVRPSLPSSHSSQSLPGPEPTARLAGAQPLVRPGETVTLTWEEAGIRLVLPVTCLDRGGLGQSVRARMKTGGRVLRAEVVGEGKLRAAL
jgi:flagellar basal body P-ring formation chaperone FlgA